MLPLESVPNVSEGSDPVAIAAIRAAFARAGRVLDVHSDPDHDRTVYTLVAPSDDALVDAVVAGVAAAVERIDLTRHDGIHPRVGAADVVPIVPLRPADEPRAVAVALEVGRRIGAELGVPVFVYGAIGAGRRPAFFRRGGLAELARRLEGGEVEPAFGPRRLHPTAGAALVGVRAPLVAFNVELATSDVEVARAIAAAVRAAGGGLPGVQAIGLLLTRTGNAQVSMNIVDVDATPLHVVVERVRDEAARRGVEVVGGELVGLVPARVVLDAAGAAARRPHEAARRGASRRPGCATLLRLRRGCRPTVACSTPSGSPPSGSRHNPPVANQKQRRRREKEKRHGIEIVEIDEDGNERVVERSELRPAAPPARVKGSVKGGKPAAGGRQARGAACPSRRRGSAPASAPRSSARSSSSSSSSRQEGQRHRPGDHGRCC